MSQFDTLEPAVQAAIRERVELRKKLYMLGNLSAAKVRILLVGDRPAPDAPDDDRFHFTPFGAEHHSSLWLNLQLHSGGIDERKLAWMNAYDRHGKPSEYQFAFHGWKHVIVLGGNAETWLKQAPFPLEYSKVHHPQAWKRFHSAEPYPLINLIREKLAS